MRKYLIMVDRKLDREVTFPKEGNTAYRHPNPYGVAFGPLNPVKDKSFLRLAEVMHDRGFVISVRPDGRPGLMVVSCSTPNSAEDFDIMYYSPQFRVIEEAEQADVCKGFPGYPDTTITLENDLRRSNWPLGIQMGLKAYRLRNMAQNALALAQIAEGADYSEVPYTGIVRYDSRALQPASQWRETAEDLENRADFLLKEHGLARPVGEVRLRLLLIQAIEDRLHSKRRL